MEAKGLAMNALHASLLVLSYLATFDPAAAPEQTEWGTADSARWDFERALRMWRDGLYGGLLYYHDGRGPLAPRLYADMDAEISDTARPSEWSIASVDCPTPIACSVTAMIRFSDEETGGLRRYRLVRDPGQFWGLHSEQILECPDGYRLQYQGVCFNIADEHSNDPDLEIRTADPIVAD